MEITPILANRQHQTALPAGNATKGENDAVHHAASHAPHFNRSSYYQTQKQRCPPPYVTPTTTLLRNGETGDLNATLSSTLYHT